MDSPKSRVIIRLRDSTSDEYDRGGDSSYWDHRYTILTICVGSYFAIRFVQLIISPAVPSLLREFSTSRGAIGTLLGGMWVVYAVVQLPSGVFSERFSGRTIALVALGLTSVASLLLAVAPSFSLFSAFLLVLGLGAGLYYNAATMFLTQQFDTMGRAIGIHRLGSPIAGLLAPLLGATIIARYGWRIALASGAVLALLVLSVFAWQIRPTRPGKPNASLSDSVQPSHLIELLRRPDFAFTTGLAVIGEFVGLATMTFLPTFFVQYHGFTLGLASGLFSVYFVIVGLFQPVSGWLSDRFGRDVVLILMMSAGVLGYGLLSVTTTIAIAFPAVIFAGFAMSWPPPIQSRAFDSLTQTDQGVGFGLVRTIYILSGALGTVVTGTVADIAGWMRSFQFLAALLIVALALLLVAETFNLSV